MLTPRWLVVGTGFREALGMMWGWLMAAAFANLGQVCVLCLGHIDDPRAGVEMRRRCSREGGGFRQGGGLWGRTSLGARVQNCSFVGRLVRQYGRL
jgi:hypothetical protein